MPSMVGGSRGAARGLGLVVAAGVIAWLLAGCGAAVSPAVSPAGQHPAASIAVAPSRLLAQGQRVQVVVQGFPAHVKVFVSECARLTRVLAGGCGNPPASEPFVSTTRRVLVTDGHGMATGSFMVQVAAETGPPLSRVAKCVPGCTIVATTGGPGRGQAVVAETVIRFGQRHPPPPPSSRVPATAPFTVLARIGVPGRAWQVLADGGALYCLSVQGGTGVMITRVDPVTRRAGPTRRVAGVTAMEFGGGLLWAAERSPSPRSGRPTLLALNPVTLAVMHTVAVPQPPGGGLSGIAYAGDLWILDGMSASIACASDATGRILAAAYDTDMNISDLAALAPDRLAIPINGKILIARPACGP